MLLSNESLIMYLENSIGKVPFSCVELMNPQRVTSTYPCESTSESSFKNYFSHYFQSQLENMGFVIDDEDYSINTDISKDLYGLFSDDEKFITSRNHFYPSKGKTPLIKPDFVFHKNQRNNDCNTQFLICEIKTNKNFSEESFFQDYFKLNVYKKFYSFRNCVYIFYNKKISTIQNYIRDYRSLNYWEYPQNEIFFYRIKKNNQSKFCDFQKVLLNE